MSGLDPSEVGMVLDGLRAVGAEPQQVEVKSGAGGFPASIVNTLVAFANGEGGYVLIGVDEAAGYAVVDLPDPTEYRDRLVGLARDAVVPPLHVSADVVRLPGGAVVAAFVPPLSRDLRPAYVGGRGVRAGSYVRSGDGDHPMSEAEVALVVASRTQPRFDSEVVEGTSRDDLDLDHLLRTVQRVRTSSPRLSRASETVLLHRLGVLSEPHDRAPLTLAGLLTFGEYPQQFFPQLMVSVVVHPTGGPTATRFLDNAATHGPLPDVVADAITVVRRNVAVRAVMTDWGGRRDVPEVPIDAVREAVANAVLHRDYSPTTRGTQVSVDVHPDRIEVRSPGGLYGIGLRDLGRSTSSRNARLAGLLADTFVARSDALVAENRSSGIPAMRAAMRDHGLPLPTFRADVTSFTTVIERVPLLGPELQEWMDERGLSLPTQAHRAALAMLRRGPVTREALLTYGLEWEQAAVVMRDLATLSLAVEHEDRRGLRWRLSRAARDVPHPQEPTARTGTTTAARSPDRRITADVSPTADRVRDAARGLGTFGADDVQDRLGLSRPTVVRYLNAMLTEGTLVAEGAPRSPRRRYRWAAGEPGEIDG